MQPVQLLTAFFVFAMSANLLHGRYRSAYALQQPLVDNWDSEPGVARWLLVPAIDGFTMSFAAFIGLTERISAEELDARGIWDEHKHLCRITKKVDFW